jgi:predicted GIY-YIG superfamily endonuclease
MLVKRKVSNMEFHEFDWSIEFNTRKDAMKLEKKIKNRGIHRWIEQHKIYLQILFN